MDGGYFVTLVIVTGCFSSMFSIVFVIRDCCNAFVRDVFEPNGVFVAIQI